MRLIAHIENGGGNKNQLNQLNVVVLTEESGRSHRKQEGDSRSSESPSWVALTFSFPLEFQMNAVIKQRARAFRAGVGADDAPNLAVFVRHDFKRLALKFSSSRPLPGHLRRCLKFISYCHGG
jgi:hypothetical protein